MLEIDDLIQRAYELKPLPATTVRLASLAASGQADLAEISEVVAYDQALTLRLLRAANSASAGGTARVTQAQEAVFRLGTARVLALTIASGARDLLQGKVDAYGFNEGQLWKHSVAAAVAAETLPEFAETELPAETFAAALLHDVGKLVMGRYLSLEDLDWIHRAQLEGRLDPLAAESEVLDVHHGELGGIVAQHWEMPQRIVEGIIYHHNPAAGLDSICDAVYLANIVAKHIEGLPAPGPDKESLERLGVAEGRLEQLITAAKSRFESVSLRYNAA